MLTIFGTIALDTTETPFKKVEKVLGGAATYASISSSYFYKTNIVGIVGGDFPEKYKTILRKKVDIDGLIIKKREKTFHYDSSFDYDLSKRTTNRTDLNVIKNFEPSIPDEYIDSKFVYLANNDPLQNLKIMKLFSNPKLIIFDTIDYWINNNKEDVLNMMSKVNGIIINDDEARLISKNANLIKCAKFLMSCGPEFIVIKKGENGSILFKEDEIFPSPAFPIEDILDPTGAGDAFAGAFIGHISKTGKTNIKTLREATIYGNVMGSFVVEDYGINKLLTLDFKKIQTRYLKYRSLVRF